MRKKPTPKSSKKTNARNLYIAGINLNEIAEALGVTERTIASYRLSDRGGDNDWDTLRAARYIGKEYDENGRLLDNFVRMMHKSVTEINNDEKMRPADKAKAIASLGDAYAKMLRVAQNEDPKAYRLALIKKTIFLLLEYLKKVLGKEAMEQVISAVNSPEFKEACRNV